MEVVDELMSLIAPHPCRRSSEEILQTHIKDLKQQLSQRDDMIDRLREDIHNLKLESQATLDKVCSTCVFGARTFFQLFGSD